MEGDKKEENPIEKEEQESFLNNRKLRLSFRWFLRTFREQVLETFDVRKDSDIPGTIESLQRDAVFRGHNIWILIFSIFIASIGLNLNSTPIVIGAMLISPLMGPIMAAGLALGTNDIRLLITAARNLLIMVVVAVATSYIYFKITPFHDAQSEILSRTTPHLFDALIGIFGGLAGIIGNSRKERSHVVPGVAIATALMPPLCTAGFGLANGLWDYFWGASYLFLLNSAFIAITCLVMVRIMRFPIVHFLDKTFEKRVRIAIVILALIIITPSFYLFYNVVQATGYKQRAQSFIQHEFSNLKSTFVFKEKIEYKSDTLSMLEVYVIGEPIDSVTKLFLKSKLAEYDLNETEFIVKQSEDNKADFQKEMLKAANETDGYERRLDNANSTIGFLESKVRSLNKEITNIKSDTLPVNKLKVELKSLYTGIADLNGGFMKARIDSNIIGRIPVVIIDWDRKKRSERKQIPEDEKKIKEWLKIRLGVEEVKIVSIEIE